jgi:hypothetical protein
MTEHWFFAKDKRKLGPVSTDELKKLVVIGQVLPTDMALKVGSRTWVAVASINGLSHNPAIHTSPSFLTLALDGLLTYRRNLTYGLLGFFGFAVLVALAILEHPDKQNPNKPVYAPVPSTAHEDVTIVASNSMIAQKKSNANDNQSSINPNKPAGTPPPPFEDVPTRIPAKDNAGGAPASGGVKDDTLVAKDVVKRDEERLRGSIVEDGISLLLRLLSAPYKLFEGARSPADSASKVGKPKTATSSVSVASDAAEAKNPAAVGTKNEQAVEAASTKVGTSVSNDEQPTHAPSSIGKRNTWLATIGPVRFGMSTKDVETALNKLNKDSYCICILRIPGPLEFRIGGDNDLDRKWLPHETSVTSVHARIDRPVKSLLPVYSSMHCYFFHDQLFRITFDVPLAYFSGGDESQKALSNVVGDTRMATKENAEKTVESIYKTITSKYKATKKRNWFSADGVEVFIDDLGWRVERFGPDSLGTRDFRVSFICPELRKE